MGTDGVLLSKWRKGVKKKKKRRVGLEWRRGIEERYRAHKAEGPTTNTPQPVECLGWRGSSSSFERSTCTAAARVLQTEPPSFPPCSLYTLLSAPRHPKRKKIPASVGILFLQFVTWLVYSSPITFCPAGVISSLFFSLFWKGGGKGRRYQPVFLRRGDTAQAPGFQ